VAAAHRVDEMMAIQRGNVGVWWDDWTGSMQPGLLLRATGSFLLGARLAHEMVANRRGSELVLQAPLSSSLP
jgi:hypothetical protein